MYKQNSAQGKIHNDIHSNIKSTKGVNIYINIQTLIFTETLQENSTQWLCLIKSVLQLIFEMMPNISTNIRKKYKLNISSTLLSAFLKKEYVTQFELYVSNFYQPHTKMT